MSMGGEEKCYYSHRCCSCSVGRSNYQKCYLYWRYKYENLEIENNKLKEKLNPQRRWGGR